MLQHKIRAACAAAALATAALSSAALATDDSISAVVTALDVEPGKHAGNVSNVNGPTHIKQGAVVAKVSSVNGPIDLDAQVQAASVTNVNGPIHLGPDTHIAGTVRTVNGPLHVDSGARINGEAVSVNGPIDMAGTYIGGGLTTVNGTIKIVSTRVDHGVADVNGDIEIGVNSRVDGGLTVHENNSGWFSFLFFRRSLPRVVIGPGAVVTGTLLFEQEVRLYVSDRATIGPVQGAKAVTFSGDKAPD